MITYTLFAFSNNKIIWAYLPIWILFCHYNQVINRTLIIP